MVRDGETLEVALELAGSSLTGRVEMNGALPGAVLVSLPSESQTEMRQAQPGGWMFTVIGLNPDPALHW